MSGLSKLDESLPGAADLSRLVLRPMRRFAGIVIVSTSLGAAAGIGFVMENTVFSSTATLQVSRASTNTLEAVTTRIGGGASGGNARYGQDDSYRDKFIGYLSSRDFFDDVASQIGAQVNYPAIRRALRLPRSPRLQNLLERFGLVEQVDVDAPMDAGEMASRLMAVTAVARDAASGIHLSATTRDGQVAVVLTNILAEAAIEFVTRKELLEFDQARSYITDRIAVIKTTVENLNENLREVGDGELKWDARGALRSSELQRELEIANIRIKQNQLMVSKLTENRNAEDARLLKAQLNGGTLTDEIKALRQQSEALAYRKGLLQLQGIDTASLEVQEIDDELRETNDRIQGLLANSAKAKDEGLPSSVRALEEAIEKLTQENVTLAAQAEATEAALRGAVRAEAPLPAQRQRYNELLRQIQVQYELLSDLYRQSHQFDFQRISVQNKIRRTERAYLGGAQRRPKLATMVAFASLIGLIFGSAVAFFLERLDPTVSTRQELAPFGLPIITAIPNLAPGFFGGRLLRRSKELRGTGKPALVAANSIPFKYLRTKILGTSTLGPPGQRGASAPTAARIVSVHSAVPGEGKSFITANLAASIALSGKRTLILDSDVLGSNMPERLDVRNPRGLVEHLRGEAALDEVTHRDIRPNLDVIFAGDRSSHSTELIQSPAFLEMMRALRTRYDCIVVDTAPINLLPDGLLVCEHADLVLLCVLRGKTRLYALTDAIASLQLVAGAKIQLLINRSPMVRSQGSYRYAAGRYEIRPDRAREPDIAS